MDKTKNMLDEEIQSGISSLNQIAMNSEDYGRVVSHISTLYKLKIEEYKIEMDYKKTLAEQESECKKSKKENIIQCARIGTEIGLGLCSLISAVWFARAGFKFEETGTYTSTTFRNSLSKFRFK